MAGTTTPTERRGRVLREALARGLLHPRDAVLAGFVDFDGLADTVRALRRAFPEDLEVLHAFAAKANCLVPVLAELRSLGMGCEVAGAGELSRALEAGFPPERIVFDSPAKTLSELRWALEAGVSLNIDNFQELERVADLLRDDPPRAPIGVRVNPGVGGGAIEAMSTATETSKFGIPLTDEVARERLLRAFRDHPWLTRLHTHVGSQGCPVDLIARGVAGTVAFAGEIDRVLGGRRVDGIDIGGGLPVNFADDRVVPGFDTHVEHLRRHAPALFGGDYAITTEFGRSVMAKNGFTAAYVEYTKEAGDHRVAITHAGVQVAARTVFAPGAWPLRIEAYHPDGTPKRGAPVVQDVAGPACFAGDLLARGRALPLLEPGDIVVLPDTGAYYFSTPFHYNGLPEPAVHGVRSDPDGGLRTESVRPAQELPGVPVPDPAEESRRAGGAGRTPRG
ncbi:diaminopimelate decarboxylase [Streptomyces sp. ST2-7A]|uniref:diaminopimelate decarboxylase n=1 Tax=Streptomyces sp. ST2-7A TaxID=2907214 RepID=UPI001F468A2B|nr:diaminopimelate decarboxylase [Streptomyces sp. ST2-7A]MCE7079631.1 diaminopimelate decarboxylase [Streptomyces sp. ST2-7A]